METEVAHGMKVAPATGEENSPEQRLGVRLWGSPPYPLSGHRIPTRPASCNVPSLPVLVHGLWWS